MEFTCCKKFLLTANLLSCNIINIRPGCHTVAPRTDTAVVDQPASLSMEQQFLTNRVTNMTDASVVFLPANIDILLG